VNTLLTILFNSELKSFDPDAHWFCPKRFDDDPIDYEDDNDEEGTCKETKQELIQDAKKRHEVAYGFSLILGLAERAPEQLLEEYRNRLDHLMTTCDQCVHGWHQGRKSYLKQLGG
jgi:senataxin